MTFVNLHASSVLLGDAGRAFQAPADAGILIIGESGSGKSDLALRLIERGALLVADDRVEAFVSGGRLCARPAAALAGLIEIRGIGIVSLRHEPQAAIALTVQLTSPKDIVRLPEYERYVPPETLALPESAWPPLVRLAGLQSSSPARIFAAAAAFAQARFRSDRNPS